MRELNRASMAARAPGTRGSNQLPRTQHADKCSLYNKRVACIQVLGRLRLHDAHQAQRTVSVTPDQESAMANSARHRRQPQPPSETEFRPRGPIDEPRAVLETPTLWHAALRSECWISTSGTVAGSWGSPFAAPGRPVLRLQRPPRRRTLLHCSRPSAKASARFTASHGEFLTD